MIKHLIFLILLTSIFVTGAASAAPYRRLVNFEWEAIEGAKSYEIELKQIKAAGEPDGKVFNFKTKEPAWNGQLSAGTVSYTHLTLPTKA